MDPASIAALFVGKAAAGGAAATTGLIGAGGAVTAAGVLTAGATLFTVTSAVQAGKAREADAKSNAALARISALQAGVQGAQEEVDTLKRLRRTLAAQEASFAAGGFAIGGGSGSPERAKEESIAEGERQLAINRLNTETRQAELGIQEQNFAAQARAARRQGLLTAGARLLGGAERSLSRGLS